MPGFKPEYTNAAPTNTMAIPATTCIRLPHTRNTPVSAGPAVDPRKLRRNTRIPIVRANIANAPSAVKNPPTLAAKTATAARNGAVQPAPTRT